MSDAAGVVAAREAFERGEAAAFAAAMREVGVVLDLPAFRAFCDEHGEWWKLVGKKLLELVFAAVHGELGYAMAAAYTRTMLVARTADHLVIGAQPATTVKQPFPAWGWPIKRWSKTDPAKNVALVEAWVADVLEHRHVMIVKRVPAPLGVAATEDHGAAVFAALVADPTDPGARAVYADWLIERGDPRGEIVRLHAEGRLAEARGRAIAAEALIREHVPKCVRHVRDWTGLVEGIEIAADDLARYGAALFARHPIHALELVATDRAQLAKLAAAKAVPLERVRRLDVEARVARGSLGDLRAIAPSALRRSRVFDNLRALRVRGVGDDLAEWQRLLVGLEDSPLRELAIGDVANDAIARFVASPTTLPHLRALRLWHRVGQPDEAIAIARAIAKRAALEEVALDRVTGDALRDVAAALVEAPALVDVTLAAHDGAIRALARGRFVRVALSGTIRAAPLAELVAMPTLAALELWCDRASIVEEVVGVLERAPARLAHVHWRHPDLTSEQAARIAATRTLEEHVVRG